MTDIFLAVVLIWFAAGLLKWFIDARRKAKMKKIQRKIDKALQNAHRRGFYGSSSGTGDTHSVYPNPGTGSGQSSYPYSGTGSGWSSDDSSQSAAARAAAQQHLQYAEQLEREASQLEGQISILESQARAARQSADAYTRDVDQLRMRGDLGGAQSALSSARHYQIDADGAEQEAQRLRWRADECRSQAYSERQQAQF